MAQKRMNSTVENLTDNAVLIDNVSHFGCCVSIARGLVDFPNGSLVEVDLPHYKRMGLGKALLRVVRYYYKDINRYGLAGISLGADTSCLHMVYDDMNPVNHGQSQSAIQRDAPSEITEALYSMGVAPELVTLAAIRYREHDSIDSLIRFIKAYHEQASWLESHPVEVMYSNF